MSEAFAYVSIHVARLEKALWFHTEVLGATREDGRGVQKDPEDVTNEANGV